MRALALWAVGAFALTGCTQPQQACTEIGALSGVSIFVDRSIAPELTSVKLKICWADQCQTRDVTLQVNTEPREISPCPTDDPDGSCSASMVPTADKVGFADVADLPAGAITVSATIRTPGRKTLRTTIDVQSATTFPNGPQCPGQGNQAKVNLYNNGFR